MSLDAAKTHPPGPVSGARRFGFVLVVVVSMLVGVAPACLLLFRAEWLIFVAVGSALVAILVARREFADDHVEQALLDRVLGAASGVYPAATLGFMLILLSYLTRFAVKLFNAISDWAGWSFEIPVLASGQTVAIFFLAVVGWGFGFLATKELRRFLFPRQHEASAANLGGLGRRKRRWLAGLFVSAVFVGMFLLATWLTKPEARWRYILLQLSLMFATAMVWGQITEAARKESALTASIAAERAVKNLLVQAGFEVTEPRERMIGLDLVALGHERKFLIQIETAGGRSVSWPTVTTLATAAWTYADEHNLATWEVEPVLVLAGARERGDIGAAAWDEGVKLARIDTDQLTEVLGVEGDEGKRLALDRWLASLDAGKKA